VGEGGGGGGKGGRGDKQRSGTRVIMRTDSKQLFLDQRGVCIDSYVGGYCSSEAAGRGRATDEGMPTTVVSERYGQYGECTHARRTLRTAAQQAETAVGRL
jgi:hypothetical protein